MHTFKVNSFTLNVTSTDKGQHRHCSGSTAYLESNHILSVDLTDVMVRQQAVASRRAVLHQGGDFARLVDEAHVAGAVFVHGDGALEGSRSRQYADIN